MALMLHLSVKRCAINVSCLFCLFHWYFILVYRLVFCISYRALLGRLKFYLLFKQSNGHWGKKNPQIISRLSKLATLSALDLLAYMGKVIQHCQVNEFLQFDHFFSTLTVAIALPSGHVDTQTSFCRVTKLILT